MTRGHKAELVTALTAVLVFLAPLMAVAGERVEVKSSTTIELPRPRGFEFKRENSKDTDTPSPAGGGFVSPPPAANSAVINKELRRLQDKRDNWIYMRPEEILMDDKTAGFFKEKENNSFLFKGLEKEKNAQERYFEEREKRNNGELDKDQKKDQNRARAELNRRETEKKDNQRNPSSSTFVFGDNGNKGFEGRFPGIGSGVDTLGKNDLGGPIKAPEFMERSFAGGLAEPKTAAGFDKDEVKKRAEQRDADFMKLIQPRSALPGAGIPGLAGGLDPVNTQLDSTRMDANPITPRQGGTLTFGDRGASSFTANDGVPSFRSELSSSSIGDLLPKAPGAPAPLGPSASSPLSTQSPVSATRPFIFEMPRRAF